MHNIIKEYIIFYYTPVFYILLILSMILTVYSLKHTTHNKVTYISMILPKIYYDQHNKLGWVHIVFVFILTFTITSFFSRLGIDYRHQGTMFQVAASMAEGKILFKDIYFHYGALTGILQAISIHLFGKKLITIQVETALF